MMIIWVIKLLVLRYSGLRGYRMLSPAFLGLILGDFLVGSVWSIVTSISGAPGYVFWPK
jgi:hypothetical protein